MKNTKSPKAARVDKLYNRFLKDGANILAKPIQKVAEPFKLIRYNFVFRNF